MYGIRLFVVLSNLNIGFMVKKLIVVSVFISKMDSINEFVV